jgi:hypothetical protein
MYGAFPCLSLPSKPQSFRKLETVEGRGARRGTRKFLCRGSSTSIVAANPNFTKGMCCLKVFTDPFLTCNIRFDVQKDRRFAHTLHLFSNAGSSIGKKEKGKANPITGLGGPYGYETSRLPHFLDSLLTDGGEVVSLTRLPPLTSRKIPGTNFC